MDNGLAALKASGAVRQARACKHPESNAPESNKFDRAAFAYTSRLEVASASRAAVPSRAPLELPTKSRCPVRSGSRGHSGRLQWPVMTLRRPPIALQ
jgi:hypothetical protein